MQPKVVRDRGVLSSKGEVGFTDRLQSRSKHRLPCRVENVDEAIHRRFLRCGIDPNEPIFSRLSIEGVPIP